MRTAISLLTETARKLFRADRPIDRTLTTHVEEIEEDDVKSLADEVLAEYRQALQEVFGNSERVTDVLEDVKLWTIGK